MSSRPWRSTIVAGERLHRRGVGDVEAHGLGAAVRRRRSPPPSRPRDRRARRPRRSAPCSASRCAIARPMPRDAPVTSATLFDRSNITRSALHFHQDVEGRQILGHAEADDPRLAMIFRTSPLSTVPGPTSTYVVTPSDARRRTTASHRTGADTCATSASIAARASRFGSASTFATIGTRGSVHRQRAQFGREPLFGRLHQRAVKRRADRQRNDALGAERLRALAGARHAARASRRSRPGPPPFRFAGLTTSPCAPPRAHACATASASRPRIAAIAPVADRHGLLHVAAAAMHRRQRVGERERAGGDVRRVLAEAVSGDERRRRGRATRAAGRPRCSRPASPAACSSSASVRLRAR